MGISLCVIARDEEKNIEKCLSSVQGLVNEIIFVDTGSKDKTISIAKKFTGKIFNFTWTDNFSDAKNFALSKATGDWILFLDADETISESDHQKIENLTKTGFLGFSFIQRNYTNETGGFELTSTKNDSYQESKSAFGYVPRKMVRFFKNLPGIKFEGAIHENIAESILKLGKIKDTNIPIHHFARSTKEKIKKYIELEKRNLKDDFYSYCKLGSQLHTLGEIPEAIIYLKKSISKNPDFPYSWLELGAIMLELGSLKEAEKALQEAEHLTNSPMLYNYLGILYSMQGKYEEAITYLKKAISLLPNNPDFHFNLGSAYLNTGEKNQAYTEMKKAISLNPEYSKRVKFSS